MRMMMSRSNGFQRRSIMAAATVLIARTISVSASAGARIAADSAGSEESRRQQTTMTSGEQSNADIGGGDKSCGCLPSPPTFDLPPPPLPPPAFGDFGSMDGGGIDWTSAWSSDPTLDSCQKEWTSSVGGEGAFVPKWTTGRVDDASGPGDDFSEPNNADGPRFLGFLDQPLAVFVLVGAAVCIVFLSVCLLAYYCRSKATRRACMDCCLNTNKKSHRYRNAHGPSSSSSNGLRRNNGGTNAKFLSVIDAASPATTTTIIGPKSSSAYRPGYSLSNGGCDSTEEISDGEHDRFLDNLDEFDGRGSSAAAKEWSYNAMRSTIGGTGKRTNGVHSRINANNFNAGYGAIPTEVPSVPIYDHRSPRAHPLPLMVTRTENGKVLTRPSPPVPPRSSDPSGHHQHHHHHPSTSALHYDSHNPIYEEISLHDKSSDHCATPPTAAARTAPRRSSEGVGNNYVDSGASSGHSDANFQFADGEDEEDVVDEGVDDHPDDENADPGQRRRRQPPRYYAVEEPIVADELNNLLGVTNSPCCSSGRSECCEECCAQESCGHNREACPFSPRPRHRQHHDLLDGPTPSMTPSPIRNKFATNKISRSTQSGESCLGNSDECYERSGRESGYGTEGRRHPTPQRRGTNRSGDSKSGGGGRKTRTMDLHREDVEKAKSHHPIANPSAKFFTMRNEGPAAVHRSPIPATRQAAAGGRSIPRAIEIGHGSNLQAMSTDNVNLHKSAFV